MVIYLVFSNHKYIVKQLNSERKKYNKIFAYYFNIEFPIPKYIIVQSYESNFR